ncbi:MAG TPA: undecaprenyl-diphosphate phosphatase [Candidatus Omnitrophota bacterium]|nr:undecaprenyl-diphosphate phosphatase [Candidatus Omnitrophota bacterium]
MSLWHALVLGAVEGISEFLPISSTGHLMLAAKLLNIPDSAFLKNFYIAVQLGAILAVVALYGRRFWRDWDVWKRVLAAFLPTCLVGFVLYKIIKQYFLSDTGIVLWALFLGGIFLILFEIFHLHPKDPDGGPGKISYKNCVLIGLCQALAVVPGVSRSAATIIGGSLLGLRRKTIVEFSFLVAVPTMLAATTLDILKMERPFSADEFSVLLAGCLASFGVALLSIKLLLYFIKKHGFIPFGIYRIAVSALFWIFIR